MRVGVEVRRDTLRVLREVLAFVRAIDVRDAAAVRGYAVEQAFAIQRRDLTFRRETEELWQLSHVRGLRLWAQRGVTPPGRARAGYGVAAGPERRGSSLRASPQGPVGPTAAGLRLGPSGRISKLGQAAARMGSGESRLPGPLRGQAQGFEARHDHLGHRRVEQVAGVRAVAHAHRVWRLPGAGP